jgi:hypothetical protein
VTAFAAALLAIIVDEAEHPPLSAAALARVIYVTGQGNVPEPTPEARVEEALEELLAAGLAERIWSRGLARYRALLVDGGGIIAPGGEGR